MAGDWIKMRVDLGDDPAVIGIASHLDIGEDVVVGKLHRLWSWADKHTIDGTTNGVTLKWVDRFVAHQGFADALCKFNWLAVDGDRLIFPNFDRHNGSSAKSRAESTIRQRLSRKNRDDGVTGLARVITPTPFVRVVHARDGNRCVYCGTIPEGKEKLGVDHLIPLTRGGKDAIENLVSCCSLCNNEKNDRTPEEFGLLPTFLPDGITYVSQQIRDIRVTKTLPEKRREEKNNKNIKQPNIRKRCSAINIQEFFAQCEEKGEKRIPDSDPVFDHAEQIGVTMDMVKVCWQEFVRTHSENGKKQSDWRATFRNYVRKNYYKLWYVEADGSVKETPQYRALKKVSEANNAQ